MARGSARGPQLLGQLGVHSRTLSHHGVLFLDEFTEFGAMRSKGCASRSRTGGWSSRERSARSSSPLGSHSSPLRIRVRAGLRRSSAAPSRPSARGRWATARRQDPDATEAESANVRPSSRRRLSRAGWRSGSTWHAMASPAVRRPGAPLRWAWPGLSQVSISLVTGYASLGCSGVVADPPPG